MPSGPPNMWGMDGPGAFTADAAAINLCRGGIEERWLCKSVTCGKEVATGRLPFPLCQAFAQSVPYANAVAPPAKSWLLLSRASREYVAVEGGKGDGESPPSPPCCCIECYEVQHSPRVFRACVRVHPRSTHELGRPLLCGQRPNLAVFVKSLIWTDALNFKVHAPGPL